MTPAEEINLAQSVQHLTVVLDLKMGKLEADMGSLRETVDTKFDALRESTEYKADASKAVADNLQLEIDRVNASVLGKHTHVMGLLTAHDGRLKLLENKDIAMKAGAYDGAKKWLLSLLLGAISAWVTVNFQSIMAWLSTFPKGGSS